MSSMPAVGTAADALSTVFEMSKLLNTGLDQETLAICVKLCEAGVNPEAIAAVVKELRREADALSEKGQASPIDTAP
eukprot:m.107479 g.107479  ORF g.107479 m.107479 type:complete len:77 (+) comp21151_c0_seq1:95-325(+)